MLDVARPAPWTAFRFFDLLQELGPLRVISVCGPSVFEAICRAGAYSVERDSINMITPDFHWHVAFRRLGHLQSCDTVHKRSGREVLFFELRETSESAAFLRIYLYRPPGEEFDPVAVETFQRAHAELASGALVAPEES